MAVLSRRRDYKLQSQLLFMQVGLVQEVKDYNDNCLNTYKFKTGSPMMQRHEARGTRSPWCDCIVYIRNEYADHYSWIQPMFGKSISGLINKIKIPVYFSVLHIYIYI